MVLSVFSMYFYSRLYVYFMYHDETEETTDIYTLFPLLNVCRNTDCYLVLVFVEFPF